MALQKEQVRVASKGQVHVAPAGTTLPTTEESVLDAAFVGLGYTSEEGVSFTAEIETEEIKAWQTLDALRIIVIARALSLAFEGLQWNADTIALAFGGGDWTEPTPGHHKYVPPGNEDALAEYAIVLDFRDGDNLYRLVIERGSITESVETQLVNNAAAKLPVTLKALAAEEEGDPSWFLLTNDESFDEGS